MIIPYSFKIGRHEYNVLTNSASPLTNVNGHFYPDSRAISVYPLVNMRWRTKRQMSETFWHETTHAILHDMGHPLWKDEAFVTAFSKRLNQVIHTARLP